MQSSKLNRAELLSLMMGPKSGRELFPRYKNVEADTEPRQNEVYVYWPTEKSKGDELPSVVVVADDALEDFLAWSTTFLSSYRPLSSFLRVLSWTIFQEVQNESKESFFQNRSVLGGAILGETLANVTGRGLIDSLSLTAFESTYSYAISRAIALGFRASLMPYISKGWQSVRDFGEQRERKLSIENLESVWDILFMLAMPKQLNEWVSRQSNRAIEILQACEEISLKGEISMETLERLLRGRVSPFLFANLMRLPREHRVVLFERVMKDLMDTPTNDPGINFAVGYLASMLGEGSLEHAQLIFPFQSQFPSAMLWYGVCASLSPASRVLTDYGHLGLRILRMLERKDDYYTSPVCDVSLAELEVIMRGHPKSRIFRQAHASFLRVELAPCITTVVRSIGVHGSPEQPTLFGEEGRQNSIEADRLRELVLTLKNGLSLAEVILLKANTQTGVGESQSRQKRRR